MADEDLVDSGFTDPTVNQTLNDILRARQSQLPGTSAPALDSSQEKPFVPGPVLGAPSGGLAPGFARDSSGQLRLYGAPATTMLPDPATGLNLPAWETFGPPTKADVTLP